MAVIDTDKMTPEQIAQLRAVLGMPADDPRTSPVRKPLTDLRAPQTAKGRLYRPHFEFSADDDGQTVIKPFPCLYWDAYGVEQKIQTPADLVRVQPDWTSAPPMLSAETPAERARKEFALLSADDQQLVLDAQKAAKMKRLHETMALLTEADLATFQKSAPDIIKAAKKSA